MPPAWQGGGVVARGRLWRVFAGGAAPLARGPAPCRSAQQLGLQVVALHVHHGLLPEADGWLANAQRLCDRWRRRGLPLQLRWERLSGQPAPGESLEAWARSGRYAALARLADEAGASLGLAAPPPRAPPAVARRAAGVRGRRGRPGHPRPLQGARRPRRGCSRESQAQTPPCGVVSRCHRTDRNRTGGGCGRLGLVPVPSRRKRRPVDSVPRGSGTIPACASVWHPPAMLRGEQQAGPSSCSHPAAGRAVRAAKLAPRLRWSARSSRAARGSRWPFSTARSWCKAPAPCAA